MITGTRSDSAAVQSMLQNNTIAYAKEWHSLFTVTLYWISFLWLLRCISVTGSFVPFNVRSLHHQRSTTFFINRKETERGGKRLLWWGLHSWARGSNSTFSPRPHGRFGCPQRADSSSATLAKYWQRGKLTAEAKKKKGKNSLNYKKGPDTFSTQITKSGCHSTIHWYSQLFLLASTTAIVSCPLHPSSHSVHISVSLWIHLLSPPSWGHTVVDICSFFQWFSSDCPSILGH